MGCILNRKHAQVGHLLAMRISTNVLTGRQRQLRYRSSHSRPGSCCRVPGQPRACMQGHDLAYVVGMCCVEILHNSTATDNCTFCGVVGRVGWVVQSSAFNDFPCDCPRWLIISLLSSHYHVLHEVDLAAKWRTRRGIIFPQPPSLASTVAVTSVKYACTPYAMFPPHKPRQQAPYNEPPTTEMKENALVQYSTQTYKFPGSLEPIFMAWALDLYGTTIRATVSGDFLLRIDASDPSLLAMFFD